MSMGVKIKIVKDPATGEDCVPPVVLDLLLRFGGHREFCEQCERAYLTGNPDGYCKVGRELLVELAQQPEVEPL